MAMHRWIMGGTAAIALVAGCVAELPTEPGGGGTGPEVKVKASRRPVVPLPAGSPSPSPSPSASASALATSPSPAAASPSPSPAALAASAAPSTAPASVAPSASVPPPVMGAAVVEWSDLMPSAGISASVVSNRVTDSNGNVFVETNLTYVPNPPDATITLKAPPGSPGVVITAYEITYEYTTPNQQTAGKPPILVGPTSTTVPPLIVPPATATAFGAPLAVPVPVGSLNLDKILSTGGANDRPGLVMAIVTFKDDAGKPVLGKDVNDLKVSIPIRAL